jgi:serine/threonine protein kinase
VSASRWGSGSVLAGRYRLEQRIDGGAMGDVWRAEHLQLKSAVAVKLTRSGAVDANVMSRMAREAEAGAALRGANVVQVLDHGVEDGDAYLVMELLQGESLKSRLDRSGALAPADVARILDETCRAVGRAHKLGIIHRDLKPANIFLARDDDDALEVVKVLDFGAVKLTMSLLSGVETRTGAMIGTPYYMSPEQLRSSKHVDHRTDLWSLAIVAFQCLTGQRPYAASSLADLVVRIMTEAPPVPSKVASVPPGFDAWFERAIRRDPAQRFQSAAELASELRTALVAVPQR